MGHVLVVGGTGMLRKVCRHLAGEGTGEGTGHEVTVIARSHARLNDLVRSAAPLRGRIHPLPLDYRDTQALALGLRAARQARGPIELAVCWIRSDATEALLTVADQIGGVRPPARLIHVLGSAAADPSSLLEGSALPEGPDPVVRRVVLGFVRGPRGSRWLADEEIAAGVIRAIEGGERESVVGVVRPWEERPG